MEAQQSDLVPSSWNDLNSHIVYGGVQLQPTYNRFPFTPEVVKSMP